MSIKQKIDFIQRIINSEALKIKNVDLSTISIDHLISQWFMSKRLDQGLRLTDQGYMFAYKAGIKHHEFVLTDHKNRLQVLLDISKYIPAPFFIIRTHPLELHIFDEKVVTAIVMLDGIENFLFSRKTNQG